MDSTTRNDRGVRLSYKDILANRVKIALSKKGVSNAVKDTNK